MVDFAHRLTPWGDISACTYLGVSDKDESGIQEIVNRHFANSGM